MRDIKFRAWNRIVMRMQLFSLPDIEKQKGNIQWQNIEIMQFTGLKDKNGKDIYEGDILKDIFESGLTNVVVYDGDCFIVKEVGVILLSYTTPGKLEVIGNIYETPLFISVKKD